MAVWVFIFMIQRFRYFKYSNSTIYKYYKTDDQHAYVYTDYHSWERIWTFFPTGIERDLKHGHCVEVLVEEMALIL